jgi:hypothetical protein
MNAPRLTDAQISQALGAHVPDRAPAGLRERITGAVQTTTQQRPMPSLVVRATALGGLRRAEGSRPNRWTLVLVAAALVTLLAAAAIFIGSQRPALLSIQLDVSPTPAVTPTAHGSPTPPAVASTKLSWTKLALGEGSPQVAWLGDQFVLVDEDSGAVRTSTDGVSWHVLQPGDPDPGYAELLKGKFATWQDNVVGWWNPEEGTVGIANKPPITARDILRIVRPPAAPTVTTPWKGRIGSLAVGPKGIVAQVHSHLDWDAWVTTKLGPNWVSHYTGVDYKNGILKIGMDNGPGLNVVWADEGFLPGDYQDAGFGWYSPDGEQWTLMPAVPPSPDGDGVRGFLTGFGDVVGVSDGFIARGIDTACTSENGCAGMWFSSDGLTWRNIGNVPGGSDGLLLQWMGGALVTDGVGRFDFWTSEGLSELPMAEEVLAALTQPNPASGTPSGAAFGTGPLGLVTVSMDDQEVLVTRDGVDYRIQPMPAAMAADQANSRARPSVIVGERSVLVVLWSGTYEAPIPSLWRGTLEP